MIGPRAIRKEKEGNGLYHIHMEDEPDEDFLDKYAIGFARLCQNTARNDDAYGSFKLKFFQWFDETAGSSVPLPKHEHIRLRIKATLMVYFVIGLLAFLASLSAVVYYTRSFPVMAENGLKGVLIIMVVQGLSLLFLSLLGLHVYRTPRTPRLILLYYNSFVFLLIAILISINWTVPESSVMIFRSELALTSGHGTPHFSGKWCCDMNGYKEKCGSDDAGAPANSTDPATTTNASLRHFFDRECSRLMGWSLAEKLIKSMSYFLIPALLTITLTNSLVHFVSSKRQLNPICMKSDKL